MPICPYCGEDKSAVKNHVRLSSGGGHGVYGEYPGDFQEGSPDPPVTGPDDDPPEDDTDTAGGSDELTMTPEEVDELVTTIEADAYDRGQQDGREAAETDPEPIPGDSTVHDEDDTTTADSTVSWPSKCPECGDDVMDGERFIKTMQAAAKEKKHVAKWASANDGADVKYACTAPFGCGYYVDEDNVAKQFDQPSNATGVLGWLVVGAAGLAWLVMGGDKTQNQDTNILGGDPRIFSSD
jgi:hypothetical protein